MAKLMTTNVLPNDNYSSGKCQPVLVNVNTIIILVNLICIDRTKKILYLKITEYKKIQHAQKVTLIKLIKKIKSSI